MLVMAIGLFETGLGQVTGKPILKKEEKCTLLADGRVSADIRHLQEDVLASLQLMQVGQERKKSYQPVSNIRKNQMVPCGDLLNIETVRKKRLVGTDDANLRSLPQRCSGTRVDNKGSQCIG